MASEFDQQASAIASRLHELPAGDQIAAACRGSGNPAALSWLAECLGLDHEAWVIDLGAGIAGPAAWLTRRYGCQIVNLEPAPLASRAASRFFGTPTICGTAERAPVKGSDRGGSSRIGRLGAGAGADDTVPDNCLVLGPGFSRCHSVAVR